MFHHLITLNEFQLSLFSRIVADIPEDQLFAPGAGHGHPPVWILGHLAITAELGHRLLGGTIAHIQWLKLFGPGSSDRITDDGALTKDQLVTAVISGYQQLRELAAQADPVQMEQPHGAEILKGTLIQTKGQLIAHLLSSHFGFHASQLSSCRRAQGHQALF